jgi:gliding motility-associated-like protein
MTYFSLPLLYSRALRVVLLFVAFFATTAVFSQTVLNRGDFAILAVNANLPAPNSSRDEISFVCFKDITTGTEIQVTDNGYSSCVTGLWSSGEGGAILRRTGATIPKGTVITFRTTTPYVFVSPDNGWTVTDLSPTQLSSNLNMNSTTGDQIYFAQGGTWTELASMCNIGTAATGTNSRIGPNASFPGNSGRILFGFSTSGEWVPGTSLGTLDGKSGNSGLYPGMQCFSMAPTGGQAYNKYFGPLTATTQTEWIKRISNVNNWETYTQSNYPTADYNFIGMTIPISSGGDIPTAEWAAPSSSICATSPSINLNTLITTGATGGTWSGTGVTGNTFNPTGLSGNYDITYTINYVTTSGSCPIAQTNTITVAALAAPVLTVLQPTCLQPTGTISVTPVIGLTYSIDGTNFSSSTTFNNLTPNTYTITAKNASGCTSTATATVTAAPGAPAAPIYTITQPTCTTATGSVVVTTVSGITYSIDGTNFSATPSFTNLTANTYTITAKNISGCTSTATATVNTAPSVPSVPSIATVNPTCITGGSITVTSPIGAGFTYSTDGTNFQTSPAFTSGIGAGNYTITVKNSSGCINSATTTINTVPSAPAAAVFTVTQPTCTVATGSIAVTTVSGITYSIDGINFSATPSFINLISNAYTITAKNASGCITTATAVVNAQPTTPSAPTLAILDNCGNSTITASGVTGTLTWSDAGTGNPRTVTTAAIYTVTQTLNGCTSAASNSVTSAPKTIPSAPTLAIIDNCGNSTITASGVTGTLIWSDAGTGNPRTVTTAASYTVTQTLNGCTSAVSNSVTSVPKTIPSAPTLALVDNCGNSTITASGVTGTLTWSDAGTGNPRTVTTAASYTVTQTINGCTSAASNSVTSAPKTIPAAPTVTTPVTYCQNAIANALTATGTNLLWYGAIATGGTASSTAPTPITTTGGSANYYVSQTVGSCESPRAAINVIVIATPAPTVISPIIFCQNASAAALSATGTNLLWYGTNATGGTSSSIAPIPLTTTAGTTNYYVSQTVSGCESPRATIAVSIEAFTISLSANPNPAFGGVGFTGQITANLPIASSIWQPSNLFVNNLSTQTIITPDTSFTLVVTGISANGCRSTASRLITVIPSNNTIFIPNALTPAAVGTDASVIKVYGTTVKTAQLLVYNQWGQLIFQTDSATTKGWDGTFNGKAQPSGVYTYVVRVVYQNNKVETKSGAINLIR